jgi:hypothetical protein
VNDSVGAYILSAFTGMGYEDAKAQFEGDKDLVLTLDHEDVEQISEQAQDYIEEWEEVTGREWDPEFLSPTQRVIHQLAEAENVADVAQVLAGVGSDGALAEGLLGIATGLGRSNPGPLSGDASAE